MAVPTEALQELVAHFLGIGAQAVTASTPLNGPLASSLGRARLDAALRRSWGVTLRACYSARTFGELQAALNGEPAASTPRPIVPRMEAPRTGALVASVGFDLQDAGELPECTDYWTHPFYVEHFTASEIAAGLLHPEPRMHFAGLWCAKESLKKSNPDLLHADWREIELRSTPDGLPVAFVKKGSNWHGLAASISITHTGRVAGAVVIVGRS
jgi:phosphopantetheinyl transferase (holo-ACP synthase)